MEVIKSYIAFEPPDFFHVRGISQNQESSCELPADSLALCLPPTVDCKLYGISDRSWEVNLANQSSDHVL